MVDPGVSVGTLGLLLLMGQPFPVKAQEPNRFQYNIVDVLSDTQTMQTTLNQYGNEGWELVTVGMGDLTAPSLMFNNEPQDELIFKVPDHDLDQAKRLGSRLIYRFL